jgi:fatty acid desaturase
VSTRARALWFGLAAALVLAGICGAVFVSDGAGQLLALVLISVGLVLATSLVFLEVGISEDRDRAREEEQRAARRRVRRPLVRPRLGRTRDHPRRLR